MRLNPEIQKIWSKFRRNKPALLGLVVILLALFLAIFGYLFSPDNSTDANTQIPELALQPPGFEAELLPLKLNRPVEKVGLFRFLYAGQPTGVRLIPVQPGTVRIQGDSVFYQKFGDRNKLSKTHLLQVFYSVQDSVQVLENEYVFKTEGVENRVSKDELNRKAATLQLSQNRVFLLGTDKYGRCMFSRLLLGFRVSLVIGLVAVLISLSIGLALGLIGGYFGGRSDDLIMLLVNTVWSIPTLLLVFAVVLALGRGVGTIFLAVGLTMWVDVARLVRGQTLALKALPFVEAARSMGIGHTRILLKHILPNLLGPVLVMAASNFSTAILVESGLSYLGFGVQAPAPSWGSMLNENYGYAISGKPLLALAPAMTIALMVLAFNLLGNGLRDAIDVKIK